jgi:ABC-type Fe3+/spermidine/putrescine transport system ATPase subunit
MEKAASRFDVELFSVTKNYGTFRAVDNFSLSAPRGSFTTLLGPSGCGKTTLLRIIAGFFEPDQGVVIIGDKDQRGIAPEKRSTGIVFQDYALFPHMTAEENLAYGLRIRKFDPKARAREIAGIAKILGLGDLLQRYPAELSGGQQQRLALGRAIILKPQILLMDEPLSNLDAKLRVRVREELKDIQKRLGITTIYVTHDQEEALSLSDYVAIMKAGRLEQAGTPEEVYNSPQTAFAADFTGPANFIEIQGKKYLVRPEWIRLLEAGASDKDTPPGLTVLSGTVLGSDFFGRVVRVKVRRKIQPGDAEALPITVDIPPVAQNTRLSPGTQVRLVIASAWALQN